MRSLFIVAENYSSPLGDDANNMKIEHHSAPLQKIYRLKEKTMDKFSEIDNELFFRQELEGKKLSNLDELEVENLVAYIMRN